MCSEHILSWMQMNQHSFTKQCSPIMWAHHFFVLCYVWTIYQRQTYKFGWIQGWSMRELFFGVGIFFCFWVGYCWGNQSILESYFCRIPATKDQLPRVIKSSLHKSHAKRISVGVTDQVKSVILSRSRSESNSNYRRILSLKLEGSVTKLWID